MGKGNGGDRHTSLVRPTGMDYTGFAVPTPEPPPSSGDWLKRVTTGDWIKIVLLIVTIVIGATQLRTQIANLQTESNDTRQTIKDMQKDIEQIKINQASTNTLLERIANESERRSEDKHSK